MEPVDVFSVRDLRLRSGELLRDAEQGRLALVTKHGKPAFVAVPFDERLLSLNLHRALALVLVEAGHLSVVRAAKVAGLALEEFIELLGEHGIPVVDYPETELTEELRATAPDA